MKYKKVIIGDEEHLVERRVKKTCVSIPLIVKSPNFEKFFVKVYPDGRIVKGFEDHYDRELNNYNKAVKFLGQTGHIPKMIYSGRAKVILEKGREIGANVLVFEVLEELSPEEMRKRMNELETICSTFARFGFVRGALSLHHVLRRKSDNKLVIIDFALSRFTTPEKAMRYYRREIENFKKALGIQVCEVDII